jgi:5-methyltetrahydropteroyltriglutamate--homocysteine methyltransferase
LRSPAVKDARAQRDADHLDSAALTETSQFVSLDQLALSPHCGFVSTEEGNVLMEDERWGKVREVVEIASEVWR